MAEQFSFKKGIEVKPSDTILEVRIEGYDGLVGMIDTKEKAYYVPRVDDMKHRLVWKQLPKDKSTQVLELFLNALDGLGELHKNGYQRRYIHDEFGLLE